MSNEQQRLDPSKDKVAIPILQHPAFRVHVAIQNGVEKNLLFKTWGGLGDQICAEPTLRYALDTFRQCRISLASERPELFRHLEFHEVFNLNKVRPCEENYLVFETITQPNESNLVWQFFSHMLTNCVDFPSLCALRSQLPVACRQVRLHPSEEDFLATMGHSGQVVLHPGRHWPSKTFPADWWDEVIGNLVGAHIRPILIGDETDDNRGTVQVDPTGCVDLRGKLSVMESVALLQRSNVVFTNDSAPLHMAASGNAWIGFIATCKHPDFITHWRHGNFGWKMENLGKGGIWDIVNHCPNVGETITVDKVEPEVLQKWLPEPMEVSNWIRDKSEHSWLS